MERQEVEKLINAEVERFRFVGIRKDRFKAIMRHLLCGDTLEINQSKVTTIFGKPVEKVDLGKWPFFDIDWSDYFRGIDKIDTVDIATLTAATNVYIGLFRGFRDISMPLGELCAILNKECGEDYWHCDESEKDLTIAQMWLNISSNNNKIKTGSSYGFSSVTITIDEGVIQTVRLNHLDPEIRFVDVPKNYMKVINSVEDIKDYIPKKGKQKIKSDSDVAHLIYNVISNQYIYPYGVEPPTKTNAKKKNGYKHSADRSSFIKMYIKTLKPFVEFILSLKNKYPRIFGNLTKRDIYKKIIDILKLSNIVDTEGNSFFSDSKLELYLKCNNDWSFDLDIWSDTIK